MDTVLRRPGLEEIEDYAEYKRLRQLAREKQTESAKAKTNRTLPALTVSSDGTVDVYEDNTDGKMSEERKLSVVSSLPDTPLQENKR